MGGWGWRSGVKEGACFRTGRWELDLQAVIPEAPCSHESKMAIKHAGWL